MEAQRVHEYTVEQGSNGLPVARIGIVHNLITFLRSGHEKVHYLDGRWVDDGKNPIDAETVPQYMKDAVAALPFDGRTDRSPDVLVNCEFCEFTGPSREYASHLSNKHIRIAQRATVDPSVIDSVTQDEPPVRLKPEDLPPGNYVTDEDGFVVLNVDGSPRRKAGRPKKDAE